MKDRPNNHRAIMATALATPWTDNGGEVRLVGTFLDREIIDSIKTTGVHPNLKLKVPEGVTAYQLEEAEQAFEGAEYVRMKNLVSRRTPKFGNDDDYADAMMKYVLDSFCNRLQSYPPTRGGIGVIKDMICASSVSLAYW